MRRRSEILATLYVGSGIVGLMMVALLAAMFFVPGLGARLGVFVVPGLVVAAAATVIFKVAAIYSYRAEDTKHG